MKRSHSIGAALVLLALLLPFAGQAQTAARKLAMYPPGDGGSRLLMSGGDIRIAVNNTDGRFTIGTSTGKSLLFGFPNEGATSHAHFFVDDSICGTYLNDGGMHPVPATVTLHPTSSSGSIVTRYIINGIEFTQRLTPTFWGDNPTVLIEYTATNVCATSRRVGVLLFLDTMIGDNDFAPIATEYGYFAVEREFVTPDIPTYWQAFESSPWQPDDSLIGGGVLVGGSAVPPDRVVFGDFWNLDDVRWDYILSGDPYSDSAVLFRWDVENLDPGESRRMATYYGMGSAVIVIGDLNLSLTTPDELTVESCEFRTPNPFPVNLIVSNATGTTIGGITANIEIPDECSFVSGSSVETINPSALLPGGTGTVSWQLSIPDSLFEFDTTLCFNAKVYGTGTDTFEVDWAIDIPGIDGSGPVAELISPPSGTTTSCDSLDVFFRLIDPDGIDETTIRVDIGGAFVFYPDPERLEFDDPFLRCRILAEEVGYGEVTVGLRSLTDNNGCPISGTDEWTIFIDVDPPEATIIEPSPGDTVIDEAFAIRVELSDISGICADDLEWSIDGYPPIEAGFADGIVELHPIDEGIVPIGLEEWHVCLNGIADDITVTCGPNYAEPLCFDFWTNFSAPRAEIIEPLPDSYHSCVNPRVQIRFHTPGEDIDPTTIRLEFDGIEYDISSPSLTFSEPDLFFEAPGSAMDAEEIAVSLTANTYSGFPITPVGWSFYTDYQPPYVIPLYPDDGVFNSPDDDIVFLIDDAGAGLDYDSTIINIEHAGGSRAISLTHAALTASGDTLRIDLGSLGIDLDHCTFIEIEVDAWDLATGCGANVLHDYFYRVDVPCTPPIVGDPDIPSRTFISCETLAVSVPIEDDEALDLGAMDVEYNDIPVDFGERLEFESGHLSFYIPRIMFGGDSVVIEVASVTDVFGNACAPTGYVYYWDNESPTNGEAIPADGATISAMPVYFGVLTDDIGAGIDPVNSYIEVLGLTIGVAEGLYYDGTALLAPSSLLGAIDEDTVVFRATIADAAGVCGPNISVVDWVVNFDQGSPDVELISPPSGAIIGCENGEFTFEITDDNGVDPASIELTANSVIFTLSDSEIEFSDDILEFNAPAGLFIDGATAEVAITAVSDSIGNAITSPHGGSFTFDFSSPEIELVSPDDDIIRGPKQRLQWRISDDVAGLDHGSINLTIGTMEYSLADPELFLDGDLLTFDPKVAEINLTDGELIIVEAFDLALNCPNSEIVENTLVLDPAQMLVISTSPAPDQFVSCDPVTLVFNIETIFGLDIGDVSCVCDAEIISGAYYSAASDSVIIALPAGRLTEGIHDIVLTGVRDTIGNELTEVNLSFIADYSSPEVVNFSPGDQAVSPLGLQIIAVVHDELAGVDYASATVLIGDYSFDVDSPELEWHGDTLVLDASGLALAGGVNVEIVLNDGATLCGANETIYYTIISISAEGPVFEIIAPSNGSITHMPMQDIRILAHDPEGIDRSTIELAIGSNIWAESDGIEFFGDTIVLIPQNPWDSGDTYRISISGSDVLGNPGQGSLGEFTVDLDAPVIAATYPGNGASVVEPPIEVNIEFAEDISGIDPATIALSVDGLNFDWGDPALSFDNDVLVFNPETAGLIWLKPDSVAIILHSIGDFPGDYGPANIGESEYAFSFIIMEKGCTALPKPFSPNGDGFYDNVTIYTGENDPAEISIYTADGAIVVTKEACGKFVWDGKDSTGRPMKPGTYVYTVTRTTDGSTLCGGRLVLVR